MGPRSPSLTQISRRYRCRTWNVSFRNIDTRTPPTITITCAQCVATRKATRLSVA